MVQSMDAFGNFDEGSPNDDFVLQQPSTQPSGGGMDQV